MKIECQLEILQSLYYSEYKIFTLVTPNFEDEALDSLLYSSFGKMLFNNDPNYKASKKIKMYIEHLKYRNRLDEVVRYNNLVNNI